MSLTQVWFMIGVGIIVLGAGIALGGLSSFKLPSNFWLALLGGVGLVGVGEALRRKWCTWRGQAQLRRAGREQSELATSLTPMLFGDYSPYVIEAAEKLGAERDTTAVPALLSALEECVDMQRPGWRDRAEALANTLSQIGDRRALPLLYRLENVRGIGFIPAIRSAIMQIEPQTSLLRPSNLETAPLGTLLRPAHGSPMEHEPMVLLRPAKSEEP